MDSCEYRRTIRLTALLYLTCRACEQHEQVEMECELDGSQTKPFAALVDRDFLRYQSV